VAKKGRLRARRAPKERGGRRGAAANAGMPSDKGTGERPASLCGASEQGGERATQAGRRPAEDGNSRPPTKPGERSDHTGKEAGGADRAGRSRPF